MYKYVWVFVACGRDIVALWTMLIVVRANDALQLIEIRLLHLSQTNNCLPFPPNHISTKRLEEYNTHTHIQPTDSECRRFD